MRRPGVRGRDRITIRAMTKSDLARARRLCGRIFPDALSRLGFLPRCASRSKGAAKDLAFVARAGERVVGIICCEIREKDLLAQDGTPIARLDMVAVDARFRRRGVATELWRRMEAKLKVMGIPSAWTRSRVLGAGVDLAKYGEGVVFLLKVGFEKRHDIYDMEACLDDLDYDTSRAEARLRREGVEIRRIEYREREALLRFLSRRFPGWLMVADAVRPDVQQGIHIARTARSVVGCAASRGNSFGPIGIEPRYQFKGIGKVLLLRCLRDIHQRGHSTASIGWANFPFYARSVSARITRVMWQMEKKLTGE